MIELLNDPVFLARMQFAFTVGFHIIFPTMNIGLAFHLWWLECRWQKTGDVYYRLQHKFWLRAFALAFGLGIVSGVVMSFQFGTNWANFSQRGMNIIGPLLGYEVLTAFFLEAGFLGVMLFGRERVSPRMYRNATACVALGTALSAFWILVANSWMQTPAGFEVRDGVLHATDWIAAVFNPSTPYRLVHMLTASFITSQFIVAGVYAYHLLRDRTNANALRGITAALKVLAVLAPLQLLIGDLHGTNTLEYQPAKVAAMEGLWETERGADLRLFAIPDQANETNHADVTIPNGASWILTHSADGEVRGLKDFPKEERPPVAPVFFAFRIMVGIGLLMILTAWWGTWVARRGNLAQNITLLRLCMLLAPSGLIATIAGWTVTEVGRQPYLVYGVFRTADGVSSALTSQLVGSSLLGFIIIYTLLGLTFLVYFLRLVGKGPDVALGVADDAPQTQYGVAAKLIQDEVK